MGSEKTAPNTKNRTRSWNKIAFPQNLLSSLEGVEGENVVQASAEGIHLSLGWIGAKPWSEWRWNMVEPHLVRTS